jgi:succinyl-CoA synthetase beta subunit
MNIHEYQAKQLLIEYGISVPEGGVASTAHEAESVARRLETSVWVVKAQIHAGGRGKGGGIKVLKDISQVGPEARKMLGMKLVTPQTGPEGSVVHKVYIEAGSNIKKEYYFSAVLDRDSCSVTFIASTEGGMDIEEVAEKTPDKIAKVHIDPATGLQGFHMRKLSHMLGFSPAQSKKFTPFVQGIYKAFLDTDASQIEINPLIENMTGDFLALDAKFTFDTNALYKHPNILALRDPNEQDQLEARAAAFELNYVKMEGEIGCMVNGAGLAMATMDIIQLHGARPANFLDVGGGATAEKVKEAFKIITDDPAIKGILVNIFGGIMKCDVIANGVINAIKDVGVKVPVIVRLEGTNSEQGKALLEQSGLALQAASDLEDAAIKIVAAVKNK